MFVLTRALCSVLHDLKNSALETRIQRVPDIVENRKECSRGQSPTEQEQKGMESQAEARNAAAKGAAGSRGEGRRPWGGEARPFADGEAHRTRRPAV